MAGWKEALIFDLKIVSRSLQSVTYHNILGHNETVIFWNKAKSQKWARFPGELAGCFFSSINSLNVALAIKNDEKHRVALYHYNILLLSNSQLSKPMVVLNSKCWAGIYANLT